MSRRRPRKATSKLLGYIMTAPAILLFLLISVYPLLNGIILSFENYNPVMPAARAFVGLENYAKLLGNDAEFRSVLGFSFAYTVSVVAFSYIMGFIFALMLHGPMRGRGVYRTLLLLPYVVAPSVAAVNWLWLLNDRIGFVNHVLLTLHIVQEPLLFLADPTLAKFTVIALGTWRGFPFMMIVILAGLQSIPRELYESAYVDGAGFWTSLRYITMPMIRTVSAVCIMLRLIWTFNSFENIYLLTGGGPNRSTFVLPILTYYTGFWRNRISYASTIAVFMLAVLVVFSLVYLRLKKKEDI
ncbi:sugar ABC transporter permease [Spirochaetia bacterium]|nr:sugar ABC transporter permease [Spirochaetia bacterium]